MAETIADPLQAGISTVQADMGMILARSARRFGSRPALVTVSLLAFVFSWNQYLLPLLVFTTGSRYTLPLGVASYQSTYSQNTGSILAFTALSMIPALAFFVLAERQLIGGVAGAVKG